MFTNRGMIMRNLFAFLITLLFIVGSGSLFAGTVDYTSDVPGTSFGLSITSTGNTLEGEQSFTAILTANTVYTSPYWYIDYITLDLDVGNSGVTVTGLVGPTGYWEYANGGADIDLLKKNNFPPNSKIGFYVDGIANGGMDINEGVLLDGSTAIWTFDFLLAGGGILAEAPGIQVGYFNYEDTGKNGGKISATQYSGRLPEPSTLILLLSSMGFLAGAAGFRKRT